MDEYRSKIKKNTVEVPEEEAACNKEQHHGKRRKYLEGGSQREQSASKRACPEAAWHPLFPQDRIRVVLLSNDNIKLSVKKDLLLEHR